MSTHSHESGHGTFTSYTIGFLLSIALTLIAYVFVANHILSGSVLVVGIMLLAIIQLFVQLVFFLHLGRDSKPRWNIIVFLFMVMVVLILVISTLWIMKNLNYGSMTPQQLDTYVVHDEGITP